MRDMELVSFAKHVAQDVAEQAASYRLGQSALRQVDRALWVVEKCARWAVPPPLDDDERPQPELVRPLPWVFFLAMLVALRVTRESLSLVNLFLGKPPLRSADVVMYIQSKRRYLRTLKYQGSRNLRARSVQQTEPWYSSLQALFEFTMCFRRSQNYGNNNTTRVSNNDEVLVVTRSKRIRDATVIAANDNSMERLIEKMMVDLDADSDDDSSFTLTNPTSLRSDRSDDSETETATEKFNSTQDSINTVSSLDTVNENKMSPMPTKGETNSEVASSTPEKSVTNNVESPKEHNEIEGDKSEAGTENGIEKDTQPSKAALSEPYDADNSMPNDDTLTESESPQHQEKYSPKEDTNNFLQNERCSPQKTASKQSKLGRKMANAFKIFGNKNHENIEALANGRSMSVANKKKGLNQRRESDNSVERTEPADNSF